MPKLSIRRDCSWSCSVNLLDRARELNIDWDKIDVIVSRIERLRHINQVEDRHQFWCVIEPETSDPTTAARRVEAVLEKIERILTRYGRQEDARKTD